MNETPENPPAFPVQDCAAFQCHGMSLRDWFAGQALASAWDACDKGYYEGGSEEIARCAYQFADALLQERAK